jgi:hypothetical protein
MFFRQMLRAGFQSATIMPVGDVIAQAMIEGKTFNFILFAVENDNDNSNNNNNFDVGRTLRWSATGLLLQGPYFFAGFSAVDKIFGATKKSWTAVAKKTITVQSLLFPPYLVLFFGLTGLMEDHPNNVPQKIEEGVSKVFVPGCMFWPVANTINFAMIPPTYRVPYSAVAGIFWSSYLSYANAKLNTTTTTTTTTTKKCIASSSSSEIIVPTMKD